MRTDARRRAVDRRAIDERWAVGRAWPIAERSIRQRDRQYRSPILPYRKCGGEAGIGIYLPEIYRLRGACLLALERGNKAEARSAFATAAGIAKRQGAVIFERRAEASLFELAT